MHKTKVLYPFSIKRFFLPAIASALAVVIAGCSSGPKSYGINGEGDTTLNRDTNGKSLSVVIRIYQLKDSKEFSKLTFDVLSDGRPESELLGPALLEKTDAVVLPGGNYTSTEKLLDDTKFIGIVGFFRRPDQRYWRQLIDAETVRSKGLNFRVQDCFIALNGIKPTPLPDQLPNSRPECDTGLPPTRAASRPTSNAKAAAVTQGSAQASGGKRGSTPQEQPDLNINAATPVGPINVQVGKGGTATIGIGEPGNGPGLLSLPR
jgi:type VI secretion system protein VasD